MVLTDQLLPHQALVLAALLRVHQRDGRATVRSVAAEAGRTVSTAFKTLNELRQLGLCAWEHGTQGTIRPSVAVHPVD